MTKRYLTPFLFILSLVILPATLLAKEPQDTVYTIRTVVLDAGHGGNKPGTRGARSSEKDVVLQVVLKLGKAIEKEIPGVKVLYTRTTDVDVDLYKRIEFANEHRADLFISIHCNATPIRRGRQDKTVRGTETFVSGFSRLGEQDAAIRENADILLED